MPRMTAKYSAALKKARELDIKETDRDGLYHALEVAGYNWSGKEKSWSENNRYMGSVFETATGTPTRHLKMRLMAHPDVMPELLATMTHALRAAGIVVQTTSDSTYPNRRGVGHRVYLEGHAE